MKENIEKIKSFFEKDNIIKILGFLLSIFAIFLTISRIIASISILFTGYTNKYFSNFMHIFSICIIYISFYLIRKICIKKDALIEKELGTKKHKYEKIIINVFYIMLFSYFISMVNELINKFLLMLLLGSPNFSEIILEDVKMIGHILRSISFSSIYLSFTYVFLKYIKNFNIEETLYLNNIKPNFNIFNDLIEAEEFKDNNMTIREKKIPSINLLNIGTDLNTNNINITNTDLYNNLIFAGNVNIRNSNIFMPLLNINHITNSFIFLENESSFKYAVSKFKGVEHEIIDSSHPLTFGINPFSENYLDASENVLQLLILILKDSKYYINYEETKTFLKNVAVLLKLTYPKENGLPNLDDFIKLLKNIGYIKVLNDELKNKYIYLKKFNSLSESELKIYEDVYIYFEKNIFTNIDKEELTDFESDEQKIFRDIFNILPILNSFLNKKHLSSIFLNKSKNIDFKRSINVPTIIYIKKDFSIVREYMLDKISNIIEDNIIEDKPIIFIENVVPFINNLKSENIKYVCGIDSFNNIKHNNILNIFKTKIQFIEENNYENISRLASKLNISLDKKEIENTINNIKNSNFKLILMTSSKYNGFVMYKNLYHEEIVIKNNSIKRINENKEEKSNKISELNTDDKKHLSNNIAIFLKNIEEEEFEKKKKKANRAKKYSKNKKIKNNNKNIKNKQEEN